MSEITTGNVNIPATVIAAPVLAIGYCANLANSAVQAGIREWSRMQQEMEQAEKRLLWLEAKDTASPAQIARTAIGLYEQIRYEPIFEKYTKNLDEKQKNILAAGLVLEKSPIKAYVNDRFWEENSFNEMPTSMFSNAASDMSDHRFDYVGKMLEEAASVTGFLRKDILRRTGELYDVSFHDDHGHVFTAFARKDKEGNTRMALDLHGYDCTIDECSVVMDKMVKYLQQKGIPFEFKKLKHNQPQGVLRKMLGKNTEGFLRKKKVSKQTKQSNKK